VAPASASTPTSRAPRPRAREGQLLGDAFRLLRADHDAQAASALLDRYLARHPAGELTEEALALRIEAALALGEDARPHARRYRATFPSGKFAPLADEILGGGLP
jgi:hypothetical protein